MLRIFKRFSGASAVPAVEVPAVVKTVAPKKSRRKKARKWLSSYRPPTFGTHARMSKDEVVKMDAAYRAAFGDDRGGQRAEREGTYKRDFVIAEFNVAS